MASVEQFVVRSYVDGDRDGVLQLLRRVWSHKQHVEADFHDRWWWQWQQPPLCVVEGPQHALVGLCAYIPFTLRAGERECPASWFVDFYVLQDYQGRGLGRRLTEAVQERFAVTASLSQTAMAWRVFEKLGWHERTSVKLYMNPLPGRLPGRAPSAALRVTAHATTAAETMTADLDRLWMRVRNAYGVIGRRDSAWVASRYAERGDRRYTLLCCHRGEECTGYMIVRTVRRVSAGTGHPEGLIVDYLVHPDDRETFGVLLTEAMSGLRAEGARRCYCISTSPLFQRVLASRGFLSPATPLLGRLLRNNTKWLTFHARPGADSVDPSAWFLTMGDCDIDYAWHRE